MSCHSHIIIVPLRWKKRHLLKLHISDGTVIKNISFATFLRSQKLEHIPLISPPESEAMAEGILFHVTGEILTTLASLAFEQLGMLSGLEDDLTKLKSNVSAIQAVLLDAENRQTQSHLIRDWLEKLEEALYDADDVLDELSTEALRRDVMTKDKNAKQVRIFFSRSNQLAFNYRMTREVKNIRERLDVISAEKKDFHLNENLEPRTGRETCSFSIEEEVIGRDDDKKKVKDLLLDVNLNVTHNVSFVAIVGMGGMGKTTLAKSLYNDQDVSECFDLKIWVWVSDQFEVKLVVEKILESATKIKPEVKEMEALIVKLQEVIGGKKYLLVMDDIWNETEEKWHELKPLLMSGAKGSKILITKRDSKVAAEVERMTKLLFTLEGLDKDTSWSLFREMAFKEGKEPADPKLIRLGEEILEKCGGVPLVIRHIGRSLYSKTSVKEWTSFKDNELWESNDMTSILKLSYNHLPPHLKQCFAYSSLFPKGYEIQINELIRQWVAQGFIKSSNGGSKSMEDIGKDYFEELCWRFFYEKSSDKLNLDDFVRMHDVMRELAKKVAGNKLYVHGNPNNDYVVTEQTRHISFDYPVKSWRDVLSKLRKAKGLRTFLLLFSPFDYEMTNNMVNESVLHEVFSSFPRLRVLDLHDKEITRVADSIKKLRHLRYLDLSENFSMDLLPNSITQLQNLQTLVLTDCIELKELPKDTRNLVSLRHLEFLNNQKLTQMPEGMETLSSLQTISLFVLDCKRSNWVSEWNQLIHILCPKVKIIGLEKLRSPTSSVNLKDKSDIRELTLEWKVEQDECKDGVDERVAEGLEPHPNVRSLSIVGYPGIRFCKTWMSNSLSKLTKIRIENCHRLQHLPPFNHLENLKTLLLRDLGCVQFIIDTEHDPSLMFFPSLFSLHLEDMPNLEGWWESRVVQGETEKPTFPTLFKLSILHCPKLTSMPKLASSTPVNVTLCDVGAQTVNSISPLSGSLNLEEMKDLELVSLGSSASTMSSLQIKDCPNLRSLPEWIGNLTYLRWLHIINCPELKSVPEGMRLLKSLTFLTIVGCPELEERCKEGGEDWPYISHVPDIIISSASEEAESERRRRTLSHVIRAYEDRLALLREAI